MTAIENILIPRTADLGGGFTVRRAIPHAERRSVGPFVFLDHMGPHRLPPGEGMDVRPHPHIALATVTWLFEGAIMHRDSLGSVQLIRPGEVNWMSAGSGIVHSERTPPDLRASGSQVHGLQFWVGLPNEAEESAPLFQHVGADDLPVIRLGDATGTLIVGSAWGATSPVKAVSRTLFTVFTLAAGG
ncbi:MAG TPA: pirin family protein, partial [Burkholderiales bacterium]|nr:pirin family protein [Burkholderiales bacterium]